MRKLTNIFATASLIAVSMAAAPALLAAPQNSNAKDTAPMSRMMQGQDQKGSGSMTGGMGTMKNGDSTSMMGNGMSGMMKNGNKMPMMKMMAEMNRMMDNCNQMMERMNAGHPKTKAEPGKG
jgi:hypothetical protein